MTYYNVPGVDPTQPVSIGGGSGGICLVNPTTNNGYYFEIAALSSSTLSQYITKDPITGLPTTAIDNILFYKVQKSGDATSDLSKAMPIKLWGGNSNIIIDDGNFTGQARFVGEANPTVYDLSIEYVDINSTTRMFYLYINQKLVNTVIDTNPIPIIGNSIGLFVRGTSKVMFEYHLHN